jgi:CBS domain-containing protein
MKVKDLMKKNVFCVAANQTLNDAAHLMWEHNCGCAPVLDAESHVTGMVTDRDIAMAAYFEGKCLAEIPISTTQSRKLVACKPEDDLTDVQLMMQSHQVHRIPVVGENSEPVGIISLNDIAMAYKSGNKSVKAKDVSDTLSAICTTMSNVRAIQAVA